MPQADFDVLTYSRDLESSGFSRQQAEAIARGMTGMLSQQLDTMVTRDHFDLHMSQVDQRFQQVDGRLDRVEDRLSSLEKSLSGHTVLLSIITLAVVIPLLQSMAAG